MEKNSRYITEDYTSYIMDGLVKRRSNRLLQIIVSILFRKTAFDAESLETLKKHQGKGIIVYASSQSSVTSLLILASLLKKNGIPVPVLALGFRQYALQKIFSLLKKAVRRFLSITGIRKYKNISDEEYIGQVAGAGKSLVLSILSRTLFLRRYVDVKKDFIFDLVELQKTTEEPILLFPEIMFWNLNPERTGANVAARSTGDRGFISGFFATRRSASPAFIRISEPVNLKDELKAAVSDDTGIISSSLRTRLHDIFNEEKRAVLGPVIRTRHEMMERVLLHENDMNEIKKEAGENRGKERKLRKKAFQYFDEIAADFSIGYISIMSRLVDCVFKKIFSGIGYSQEDFAMIREAAKKGPVVVVPSHKSHMDYVIISCLFYSSRIMPPHIVAGANLRFFPMGIIFRHCGAFFMRRSFRGLDLYAVVFKQYIKTLVAEGYTTEFFIEGGRTRTGKVLFPKLGILKYIIEAVNEGYSSDVQFLPATINYERVLEENSYSSELKGKEKKKESTVSFVRSRSLLKRNYGRLMLCFNKPVSLMELRNSISRENETEDVAMYLSRRINEITMVTPFSLVTSAMLFSGSKGFSLSVLRERVTKIMDYLVYEKIPMTDYVKPEDPDSAINYVIDFYKKDSIVGLLEMSGVETGLKENLEDVYFLNEDERIKISFYRNTIIHYIVPLSFFSIAFLKQSDDTRTAGVSGLYSGLKTVSDIFSREFIYPDIMSSPEETVKRMMTFLAEKGVITVREDSVQASEEGLKLLRFYGRLVEDYLESYLIVFDETLKTEGKSVSEKDLIASVRKNGVGMYNSGIIKLVEALSISNYKNAVSFMKKAGYLAGDKKAGSEVLRFNDREKIRECLKNISDYLELVRK